VSKPPVPDEWLPSGVPPAPTEGERANGFQGGDVIDDPPHNYYTALLTRWIRYLSPFLAESVGGSLGAGETVLTGPGGARLLAAANEDVTVAGRAVRLFSEADPIGTAGGGARFFGVESDGTERIVHAPLDGIRSPIRSKDDGAYCGQPVIFHRKLEASFTSVIATDQESVRVAFGRTVHLVDLTLVKCDAFATAGDSFLRINAINPADDSTGALIAEIPLNGLTAGDAVRASDRQITSIDVVPALPLTATSITRVRVTLVIGAGSDVGVHTYRMYATLVAV